MTILGLPYTDDQLFSLCHLALPAWASLMLAPRWKGTKQIVTLTVAFFSLLYTGLFGTAIVRNGFHFMDMGTLSGVRSLMSHKDVTLAGWVHYAAYDLLIAYFATNNNLEVGRPIPLLAMPVLLLLMMLSGPAGLVAYIATKMACESFKKSKSAAKRKA